MRPIPEDGNLIAFADLRPDHVETDVKGNEVVALLIHESSRAWRINAVGESEPERVEAQIGYIVFELDAAGQVTGDWGIDDDLDDARGFLDERGFSPDVAWEDLPPDRDAALAKVQKRLAERQRGD